MSIFGSLQDLSLADIIQAIAGSQKTGMLYVNSNEGRSAVAFKNGFVVSASKPDLGNRLGQLLMKQYQVSDLELDTCLKEQHQTGKPLGEILLDRFLVTREQLQATMRQQVMDTVNEIVNLEEGSFSFHAETDIPPDQISLDPQHLLLDVAFLQDSKTVTKGSAIESDSFFPGKLIAGMEDELEPSSMTNRGSGGDFRLVRLLRELAEELASPHETTEVSLLILRLAAEYFDRCLFLVKTEEAFMVCGGFGFAFHREPSRGVADQRILVPLSAASIFKIVSEGRQSYQGPLLEGTWGQDLIERVSDRLPHEVAVLPIISQSEVIALLYGDNGEGQEHLGSMDLLEILLLQAGMALENSSLRAKLLKLTTLP